MVHSLIAALSSESDAANTQYCWYKWCHYHIQSADSLRSSNIINFHLNWQINPFVLCHFSYSGWLLTKYLPQWSVVLLTPHPQHHRHFALFLHLHLLLGVSLLHLQHQCPHTIEDWQVTSVDTANGSTSNALDISPQNDGYDDYESKQMCMNRGKAINWFHGQGAVSL